MVFFEGAVPVFHYHGNIFTYSADTAIRNLTGFIYGSEFSVAYDCHFPTNNLALVQDTDATPRRPSLLLLGESFTKGQGAEPCFHG